MPDGEQHWPCESVHRFTVSLDGVKPLTITLPHAILPDTLKATLLLQEGIVQVAATKTLNDLWPEDVIRDKFRWNPDKLQRGPTSLPWIFTCTQNSDSTM